MKYGIDFTGGADITVQFGMKPPVDKIRSVISARIPGEISVQEITGKNQVVIGTGLKSDQELLNVRRVVGETLSDEQLLDLTKAMTDLRNSPAHAGVLAGLNDLASVPGVTPAMLKVIGAECSFAQYNIVAVESIGPKIGAELRNKAVLATLYALGGMLKSR